jgi:hypothetical protein
LLYHSAAAYTSLGDSQPATAEWRLMTTVEALAGLVLIKWTASFTLLGMQTHWGHHESAGPPDPPGGVARTPAWRAEPTAVAGDRLRAGSGICV